MILTDEQFAALVAMPHSTQAQFIFTHVATHLLAQGKKSGEYRKPMFENDVDFACLYRSPDGCACAIGALIPDSRYAHNLEGLTVINLVEEPDDEWADVMRPYRTMLQDLQLMHDSHYPGDWRKHLTDLAEHFKLEMPS